VSLSNFDPELVQDFLTESGELLEQLDQDLVQLEGSPADPELLNRVFRALHTIKGSASFLALTNLVSIAHAAESALNAARNRTITVDRSAMDLLLAAVDVVKRQFVDLREARPLTEPDAALVARLTALGEGRSPAAHAPTDATPPAGQPAPAETPAAPSARPLVLPPNKMDLLEFLVADLDQSLEQAEKHLASLTDEARRAEAGNALADLAESMGKTVEFFECAPMLRLVSCLGRLGHEAGEQSVASALEPARRVLETLRDQSRALSQRQLLTGPVDAICTPIEQLGLDTMIGDDAPAPATTPNASNTSDAPGTPAGQATAPEGGASEPSASGPGAPAQAGDSAAPANAAAKDAGAPREGAAHAPVEQTIRVEVGRLETLLNLVGELVLQKNRVSALSRQLLAQNLGSQEYREQVTQVSGNLDRVTSDLQLAVMRTRMQPLEKLFGKYPRLVRDLARKLNKQITLEVEGGETEVDKSVIEELGDPLVHLMRNAADHGIETPAQRAAAGKPEQGVIGLKASNSGGHVEIIIRDDGKGLDPKLLGRKAVEKGVITQAQLEQLNDKECMRLIFAPGFSTAEKISDVSGRGVGMDVVKTNIEKIKGTIDLSSEPGKGTTVTIKIPLTVAIMNAMMVAAGKEIYAVPLSSIVEIVKPEPAQLGTVNQHPVMRLRESVLPLLQAGELFAQRESDREDAPFAVVLQQGESRIGLLVSRLIGQQEIVIKPLDDGLDRGGPVSGATVRDDGGVSLIVDVPRVFQIAQSPARRQPGPRP
jgi:two-component system chemotaxis sensor kinase CheA